MNEETPKPAEPSIEQRARVQAALRRMTRERKYSPEGMRKMNAEKGVGRPMEKVDG